MVVGSGNASRSVSLNPSPVVYQRQIDQKNKQAMGIARGEQSLTPDKARSSISLARIEQFAMAVDRKVACRVFICLNGSRVSCYALYLICRRG